MRTGRIRSCTVRVFTGRHVIATGGSRGSPSRRSLVVRLRLTGAGKALLARRLGGARARLRARARTSGGVRRARARTRAILRVEHFTTPPGSWLPDRATLTTRGRSYVRRLRGKLVAIASLRCDGYEADVRSSSDATSHLSLARAAAMCAALRELGVDTRPRLVGHGDTDPIARNASESGRAKNRRVEVTVTHKPEPLPSSRSRATQPTQRLVSVRPGKPSSAGQPAEGATLPLRVVERGNLRPDTNLAQPRLLPIFCRVP
jgi:hypothetical protein